MESRMMEPLAFRPNAVAGLLGISRTAVYDLMRSGQLRAVKAGRSTLIPADSLKQYVASLSALRAVEAAHRNQRRAVNAKRGIRTLPVGRGAGVDPDWDA